MAIKLQKSWLEFRQLITVKNIQWQFDESNNIYHLYGVQGPFEYGCMVFKDGGPEQGEFETVYKNNSTPFASIIAGRTPGGPFSSFNLTPAGELKVDALISGGTGASEQHLNLDPAVGTKGNVMMGTDGTLLKFLNVIPDRDIPTIPRLQVEAELKPGQSINIGSVSSDPTLIFAQQMVNGGGSPNMLVIGTLAVPVDFIVNADPLMDILVSELRFVHSNSNFIYDGVSFGQRPALANGIVFDLIVNGGVSTTLLTAKVNEDIFRFASSTGLNILSDRTTTNQILISSFLFGGNMRLKAGTADRIRVRIRDNLTHVSYKYLTCTVYGQKV